MTKTYEGYKDIINETQCQTSQIWISQTTYYQFTCILSIL